MSSASEKKFYIARKRKTVASKYKKIDSYFRPSAATIADNVLNNKQPHVTTAVTPETSNASADKTVRSSIEGEVGTGTASTHESDSESPSLSVALISYSVMNLYVVDFN